MIDFKCPRCGEVMSVPESLAGQTESCPSCRSAAVVPVMMVERPADWRASQSPPKRSVWTRPLGGDRLKAQMLRILCIFIILLVFSLIVGAVHAGHIPLTLVHANFLVARGLGYWSVVLVVCLISRIAAKKHGKIIALTIAFPICIIMGVGGPPQYFFFWGLAQSILYWGTTWAFWTVSGIIWKTGRPQLRRAGQPGGEAE